MHKDPHMNLISRSACLECALLSLIDLNSLHMSYLQSKVVVWV